MLNPGGRTAHAATAGQQAAVRASRQALRAGWGGLGAGGAGRTDEEYDVEQRADEDHRRLREEQPGVAPPEQPQRAQRQRQQQKDEGPRLDGVSPVACGIDTLPFVQRHRHPRPCGRARQPARLGASRVIPLTRRVAPSTPAALAQQPCGSRGAQERGEDSAGSSRCGCQGFGGAVRPGSSGQDQQRSVRSHRRLPQTLVPPLRLPCRQAAPGSHAYC